MNYPKYESYKDSGIDWLGEIPSDWDLIPNKHIFKLKNIKVGKKSSEYDLLSLTLKGVIKRDMENPEGKFPAEFDTYQEVKNGNFIFCMFDVQETPRTVGLSKFDGMITGAYTVFDVNENYNRDFLYYFYLNLDLDKRLKPLYRGLRNTIPKEWFLNFKTFVPSFKQQKAIANFLDDKTAQIDQAIALKQQQIEKLGEYKQIVIQNAVTKGLNPNAPMKNSGVDWIGDIPEHWEVKKLKFIFDKIQTGTTPISQINGYFDGEINWFTPKDLNNDYLLDSERKLTQLAIVHKQVKLFEKNSVLVVGIGATSGKTSFMPIEGAFNQQITAFKSYYDNNKFYYYLIQSLSSIMLSLANYTTLPILNNEFFKKLILVQPPLAEQNRIVEYLNEQMQKFNNSKIAYQTQIDRLKEYKNILINQAVTGKIKI